MAIVVRRGYGDSDGKLDRKNFGCREANFEAIAEQDSADLQAAYDFFAHRPNVDGEKVVAVGHSTGGFAVVAFGAKAHLPLRAVINFSGGWHTLFFTGVCTRSGLAPEFHKLGSESHVPMLWIYARNDHLFGQKFVTEVHDAFTSGGGNAELALVERSGDDGHDLFSDSPNLWGPIVQRYLAQHGLPAEPLFPDPSSGSLRLPVGFSDEAQRAFQRFQALGPYKAFAVGPGGAWSYASGKKTPKLAADEALGRCGSSACIVIAKDAQ